MKSLLKLLLVISAITLTSCSENYSNGERIGVITQFSNSGVIFESHEGHLNVTQTGMNSSVPFDFSIDNDREDPKLIATIDSAAQYGWKVKLVYHETFGKNWFSNRGDTNHFITKCEVLEKNFGNAFNGPKANIGQIKGKVIDTIYVVITNPKKK
jgi:hypothetical protein